MKRSLLTFLIITLIIMGAAVLVAAESPDATPSDEISKTQDRPEVESSWLLHPPVVDGDLSEWAGQTRLYLNGENADYPADSDLYPPEDISAWASVAWTSQRVYLALSVTDDYVVSGSREWRNNDMAGVVFDVDNSGDFSANDLNLTLSPNNMLTANGGWPAGYEWAIRETDDGWQGEVSIPMSEFGGVDFLGDLKVGFTWGVQDDDGIGVENWMSWAGPEFLKATPEEGLLTFTNGPVRKWVAFHPGVNGYDGIVDSTLDSWHPDQRYGDSKELSLYSRNAYHLVLKFDIPDLGPDVRVLDAKVHVNFTSRNHDWISYVRVYRLLRPWDESTVTWYNADASTRWAVPGAGSIGKDRESRRVSVLTLDNLGWKTFDLANDVAADIYAHPEKNYGLIFRAEEGSAVNYHLSSSEAGSDVAPWIEVYAEFPPDQSN
jgi:hypothetical protein